MHRHQFIVEKRSTGIGCWHLRLVSFGDPDIIADDHRLKKQVHVRATSGNRFRDNTPLARDGEAAWLGTKTRYVDRAVRIRILPPFQQLARVPIGEVGELKGDPLHIAVGEQAMLRERASQQPIQRRHASF